jgi:hypothetical protein
LIATPGLVRPVATTRNTGPARASCRALPAFRCRIENERACIVNKSVDTFNPFAMFRACRFRSGAGFGGKPANSGVSPAFRQIV